MPSQTKTTGATARQQEKAHGRRASLRNEADARDRALLAGDPRIAKFAEKCRDDPRFFIESCLFVHDGMHGGQMQPFRINKAQDVIMRAVEEERAAGRPVRLMVLKARRLGITTFSEALLYWLASTRSLATVMEVAHDLDSAKEIHRIAKLFYQNDARHKLGIIPLTERSNERALRFANPSHTDKIDRPGLESSILVETAEGQPARGLTLRGAHGSEVGFWGKMNNAMSALEIALSNTPDSLGIMESTANGTGNLFHDMWKRAERGTSGWRPIFLPWMLHEDWSIRLTDSERAVWDWESGEERDYAEGHKLTLEQVKWRRREMEKPAYNKPGLSREDVFRQEHPATPDEAFIASGRNFFLVPALEKLERSARGVREPLTRGAFHPPAVDLRKRAPSDRSPIVPAVNTARWGPLSIWEMPIAGEDYVIGADVSEGLMHRDESVAWVFRRSTCAFVARYATASLDPDLFGEQCALLGWFYGSALLGIERNGPGISANLAARRIHYPRIWYDRAVDQLNEPERYRYGWNTSVATRLMMLNELEAEIREGLITMPSKEFFEQARRFVNNEGRPEAEVGEHDDEIMAAAITLQMHRHGGAIRKGKTSTLHDPPGTIRIPRGKRKIRDNTHFGY